jgi:KRAB domain-containing zinc finger protein
LKRRDFQCPQCDKAFGRKETLTQHINTTHKKIKKYSCDLCVFSSYKKAHLEIHSKTVHLGIKDFKCDICDKAFGLKGILTKHINATHKKIKKYWCDLCDYSSYTKCQLDSHSNNKHPCAINIDDKDANFDHKNFDEKHSNAIRLGIKDFKCELCEKAFTQKGNLKGHVNSVHKKLARYRCDLCDYSSYLRANLETHSNSVHLKIKKGPKNFKCDICDKAFSSKGLLDHHVNRIYKLPRKKFSCELCSSTSCAKCELKNKLILKYAHQSDVKVKEEDQMPETYSDHKNFEEILVETTDIDIKEEFVADPLALDIDDKEAKVKEEM